MNRTGSDSGPTVMKRDTHLKDADHVRATNSILILDDRYCKPYAVYFAKYKHFRKFLWVFRILALSVVALNLGRFFCVTGSVLKRFFCCCQEFRIFIFTKHGLFTWIVI